MKDAALTAWQKDGAIAGVGEDLEKVLKAFPVFGPSDSRFWYGEGFFWRGTHVGDGCIDVFVNFVVGGVCHRPSSSGGMTIDC